MVNVAAWASIRTAQHHKGRHTAVSIMSSNGVQIQGDDELVQPLDLGGQELHAPTELPQRDAYRVVSGVTGAGPQGGDRLGGCGRAVPGAP